MSEVNKALAPCHFQNDDVVQPSLYFWRALVIECLENTTGAELGDNGLPKRFYQIPVYTPCDKQQEKIWQDLESKQKEEKVKLKDQKQRCQKYSKFGKILGSIINVPRVYYCTMDALQIIKSKHVPGLGENICNRDWY